MNDLLFQRIRYTDPIRYRVFDRGRLIGVVWKQGNAWVVDMAHGMTWKTRQAAGDYLAKDAR